MISVYETLRALLALEMCETVMIVKEVYFKFSERPLKKNEVSLRVRRFATDFYMDERTVYRHLRLAKCSYFSYLCNGKIL